MHTRSCPQTIIDKASNAVKDFISKIKDEAFNSLLFLEVTKDTDYSLWRVAKVCQKPVNHITFIRKSTGR